MSLSGKSKLQPVSDAIKENLSVVLLAILVSQLLSLKHIELSTKIFTDEAIERWLSFTQHTQGGRGESQPGLESASAEAGVRVNRRLRHTHTALFLCIFKIFHNRKAAQSCPHTVRVNATPHLNS